MTAAKPRLEVVREGNPGKRPLRNDLELPPHSPQEPKWKDVLPDPDDEDRKADVALARKVAAESWGRWSRVLGAVGILSELDSDWLCDAAVCKGQLAVANRDWARKGAQSLPVPRPSLTQLRADFARYAARLYLSPSDRVGIDVGAKDGDDADFDRPTDTRRGDPKA